MIVRKFQHNDMSVCGEVEIHLFQHSSLHSIQKRSSSVFVF